MKKRLLILCMVILFLGGCSNPLNPATPFDPFNNTNLLGSYTYPELKQLVGKHISEVQKRIGAFVKVDTGSFSSKYYLQHNPRRVISYERRCNFYGCWDSNPNFSTWGFAYFVTDKEGFITKYVEEGDEIWDYRKHFKDLIVLER